MTNRTAELNAAIRAEDEAYAALLDDPRVIADPTATHTPELWAAYIAAADKLFAIRESMDALAA